MKKFCSGRWLADMKRYLCALLFSFILLHMSILFASQAVDANFSEFAYAIPVAGQGSEPGIVEISIPQEIYQAVNSKDLTDVRVFDQDKTALPHIIESAEPEGKLEQLDIPFFPIYGVDSARKFNLVIKKDAKGNMIRAYAKNAKAAAQKKSAEKKNKRKSKRSKVEEVVDKPSVGLSAYLLVTKEIKNKPLESLNLDWAASDRNWLFNTCILGSNDLSNWQPIEFSCASLANFHHQQQLIIENQLPLKQVDFNYLLLTWRYQTPSFQLTKVQAKAILQQSEKAEKQLFVSHSNFPGRGEYEYELNGVMPISSVDVRLPGEEYFVKAEIYSKESVQADWRFRNSGVFYRLKMHHQLIQNKMEELSASSDRFWLIRVKNPEMHLGREPQLEVAWFPQRLRFIPSGKEPYIIAYGNPVLQHQQLPDMSEKFATKMQALQVTSVIAADLGAAFEVAGQHNHQFDWQIKLRQGVLWGLLLLGLSAVVWIAVILIRQFSRARYR